MNNIDAKPTIPQIRKLYAVLRNQGLEPSEYFAENGIKPSKLRTEYSKHEISGMIDQLEEKEEERIEEEEQTKREEEKAKEDKAVKFVGTGNHDFDETCSNLKLCVQEAKEIVNNVFKDTEIEDMPKVWIILDLAKTLFYAHEKNERSREITKDRRRK